MFIVGLTGGIASGKTTATNFFKEKGISIIDADEISRELQQSGSKAYEEIVTKFGKKILEPNKEINRTILREIAFSNINTRKWLENLMHPLIKEETIKKFSDTKSKWAIYSAPLWSKENIFSRTLVIDAPKNIQIKRLLERDSCSKKTAEEMIDAQLQSNERNNFATDLIINDDSIEIFESKLDFYFNLYNKLADE
tara:strand:+ start:57 stop:644 length:588 start_codon:yes stop_codon:yes gene_type:complete